MRFRVDGAGRVVLPKPLRKEPDPAPGDTLELETTGGHITLRPVRGTSPISKEKGVRVFRTGRRLTGGATNVVMNEIREKRERSTTVRAGEELFI